MGDQQWSSIPHLFGLVQDPPLVCTGFFLPDHPRLRGHLRRVGPQSPTRAHSDDVLL